MQTSGCGSAREVLPGRRAQVFQSEHPQVWMTGAESEGIREDGVLWMGTRAELEAWKRYKQKKALAFVERGYSVGWYPDGDGWISVYHPERWHARAPEVRADIKVFGRASRYGIDGGMVSKLTIAERRTDILRNLLGPGGETVRVLYNYDRGLDVDRLDESPAATALYRGILDELN